jgi:hypothetical protein
MHVAVVKARHDALAGEIEHAGLRPDEQARVLRRADENDTLLQDGERLGFGLLIVDGPDLGVEHDQIGGGKRRGFFLSLKSRRHQDA